MARKPLTRITAKIGSSEFQLASVRETTEGRLILNLSKAKDYIELGQQETVLGIKEQKYTIHLSPNAADGGNQIHYTVELNDGSTRESYLYTTAIRDGFVCNLFNVTMRRPATNLTIHTKRAKDTYRRIAAYDPSLWTLHYQVFLGPADASLDHVAPSKAYSRHIVKFKKFSILLLTTYTRLPSANRGWVRHHSTAAPVVSGKPISSIKLPPDPGLSAEAAAGAALIYFTLGHQVASKFALDHVSNLGMPQEIQSVVRHAASLGLHKKPRPAAE